MREYFIVYIKITNQAFGSGIQLVYAHVGYIYGDQIHFQHFSWVNMDDRDRACKYVQ